MRLGSISVNTAPHADHLGKNDGIFTVEGTELFKRDIPVQSSIFSTRAIFAWKKKWIGWVVDA